ncbi:MAG: hypothetical protein AB7D37_04435 [Desulfovibrio sp.]
MSTAWIQTYSGRRFDLLEPDPKSVSFRDIAHALANSCRFNGHSDKFYSVAEHSIIMSHMVPPEMAKWALFHDAAEAYAGDMVRPLKELLPEFSNIENRIASAIAKRFKLGMYPKELHVFDLRMLATEARELMLEPPVPWGSTSGIEPFDCPIHCWTPREAEELFYFRHGEILGEECLREEAEDAA